MSVLQYGTCPETVYDRDNLLVVYKPSGYHSVDLPEKPGNSIASWLAEHSPLAREFSDKPEDAGLVQRLDFDSCGLLLAAKSKEAWILLRKALEQGLLDKTYWIVTEGLFPETCVLEGWIGNRHRGSSRSTHFLKEPPNLRALPARTEFLRIGFNSSSNVSLVEARTGPARRHQVRLHASELGHPLAGDSLYGSHHKLPGFFDHLLSAEGHVANFFLLAATLECRAQAANFHMTLPGIETIKAAFQTA